MVKSKEATEPSKISSQRLTLKEEIGHIGYPVLYSPPELPSKLPQDSHPPNSSMDTDFANPLTSEIEEIMSQMQKNMPISSLSISKTFIH